MVTTLLLNLSIIKYCSLVDGDTTALLRLTALLGLVALLGLAALHGLAALLLSVVVAIGNRDASVLRVAGVTSGKVFAAFLGRLDGLSDKLAAFSGLIVVVFCNDVVVFSVLGHFVCITIYYII